MLKRLKATRVANKLSQGEIAKQIGVTQVAYSYIERGLKNPSLAVAIRLAEVLNVSLDYLIGIEPKK